MHSIRSKILIFTLCLILVPLICFLTFIWRAGTGFLWYEESKIQSNGSSLVVDTLNADYYTAINEQLISLTQIRSEIDHQVQVIDNILGKTFSPEWQQALQARSAIELAMTAMQHAGYLPFIYDRINRRNSVFVHPSINLLLNGRDLRGIPLKEHLERLTLPAEGANYYLRHDTFGRFLVLIRPSAYDEGKIIGVAYNIDAFRQSYANPGGQVLESFQLLSDSIELEPGCDVVLLNEHYEVVAAMYGDGADTGRDYTKLPLDYFQQAALHGYYQAVTSGPFEALVQINHFKPLDWYVVASRSKAGIEESMASRIPQVFWLSVAMLALALTAGWYLSTYLIRQYERLAAQADRISSSDMKDIKALSELASVLQSKEGPGDKASSFAVGNLLKTISSSMDVILSNISRNNRVQGELQAAEALRTGCLLPPWDLNRRSDLKVELSMIPGVKGGDFYDVVYLEDDKAAFVLGSVSGEGIKTASFLSMTVTLLRHGFLSNMDPGQCMHEVNQRLCQYNPHRLTASIFAAVIDLKDLTLTFSESTACPPLILDRDGLITQLVQEPQSPLGQNPEQEYQNTVVHLKRGAQILLYTKGVLEGKNSQKSSFGISRLKYHLDSLQGATLSLTTLADEFLNFTGDAPLQADATMLCLKLK